VGPLGSNSASLDRHIIIVCCWPLCMLFRMELHFWISAINGHSLHISALWRYRRNWTCVHNSRLLCQR